MKMVITRSMTTMKAILTAAQPSTVATTAQVVYRRSKALDPTQVSHSSIPPLNLLKSVPKYDNAF